MENEVEELRGPALVAWLVANTEKLVVVAAALDGRATDLAPSVPPERIVELCKTVRQAALEITVSLLALLSQRDQLHDEGVLAEAIANAHARLQQEARHGGGSMTPDDPARVSTRTSDSCRTWPILSRDP